MQETPLLAVFAALQFDILTVWSRLIRMGSCTAMISCHKLQQPQCLSMLPIRLSHDLGAAKAFTCMSTLEEDVSFHWTSTCYVTQMDWDTESALNRDTKCCTMSLTGWTSRTVASYLAGSCHFGGPTTISTNICNMCLLSLCVPYVCNKNDDNL